LLLLAPAGQILNTYLTPTKQKRPFSGRFHRNRFFAGTNRLVQPETHFHVDLHRHWLAIFHGGLEFPLLHGFDGLLVKT
jgi:hypothetical protein